MTELNNAPIQPRWWHHGSWFQCLCGIHNRSHVHFSHTIPLLPEGYPQYSFYCLFFSRNESLEWEGEGKKNASCHFGVCYASRTIWSFSPHVNSCPRDAHLQIASELNHFFSDKAAFVSETSCLLLLLAKINGPWQLKVWTITSFGRKVRSCAFQPEVEHWLYLHLSSRAL